MDDLADELGMSKKTLYTYFPSKTALLEAVILDKLGSVESDLATIASESASDFPGALENLLACVQRHTEEIGQSFVRDLRREAPDMFKLVESRRRDFIHRYFGELFDKGRRAGIIRKDIPPRLMIEILLGAVEAIMNPQKMPELGITPKTGFTAILRVILNGVVTEKGKAKL
jgi:AcrR family transcriptional regulator